MRACHALDSNGVHMRVQQERAATAAAARDANHVGASGRGLVHHHLQPRALKPSRHETRDIALARASRHKIGVDGIDCYQLS